MITSLMDTQNLPQNKGNDEAFIQIEIHSNLLLPLYVFFLEIISTGII